MYKIINRKKLFATAIADTIGKLIFLPKLVFQRKAVIKPEEIRSILLIRTAYIGDVVMTLPMLKPLKQKFPQARISFLTGKGAVDVLKNNAFVDEAIGYNPFWFYPSPKRDYFEFIREFKKRRFDLVIEARGDIRELMFLVWPLKARYTVSYTVGGGGYFLTHTVPYKGVCHRVDYHLDMARHLGCSTEELDWGICLTEEEKKSVGDILRKHGIEKPFIAVHPGSRLSLKRWLPDRYGAVCDRLAEETRMPVVVFGGAQETGIAEEMTKSMKQKPVSLAGNVTIREFAGLLSHAALFLCNDSAPMHIAAAMKTPTLAIFGPSKSIETGPYGEGHRVVEKNFQCRYACDENSCRHERYNACMTDITVDDVYRSAQKMLARSGDHYA